MSYQVPNIKYDGGRINQLNSRSNESGLVGLVDRLLPRIPKLEVNPSAYQPSKNYAGRLIIIDPSRIPKDPRKKEKERRKDDPRENPERDDDSIYVPPGVPNPPPEEHPNLSINY